MDSVWLMVSHPRGETDQSKKSCACNSAHCFFWMAEATFRLSDGWGMTDWSAEGAFFVIGFFGFKLESTWINKDILVLTQSQLVDKVFSPKENLLNGWSHWVTLNWVTQPLILTSWHIPDHRGVFEVWLGSRCDVVFFATKKKTSTWMSRWNLGSMVRINGLFHLLIHGIY